jgi:hypothetical protein
MPYFIERLTNVKESDERIDLKGLDMARKCVCQLDYVDYFITRCIDPENELHRELKFKKSKFIDWLNKHTLQII